MKNFFKLISIIFFFIIIINQKTFAAEETKNLLKTNWSFKGYFGKFDRGALQRGYQVYT